VDDPRVRPEWVEQFRTATMAQHPFWVTQEQALARLTPPPVQVSAPSSLKGYGRRSKTAVPVLVEQTREEL
jgi:hypothetical protein